MHHPVKEKNMHELAEYQKTLWKKPKLRFLFFELTDKCNLGCRHCGSNCTSQNKTFLPYEEIEKVMVSVTDRYDPNEIMICITGGEPMLHPDLMKIIYRSRCLGFHVGITTNGTLIDDKAAEDFVRSGLETIAISIDGLGETHDRFRGVKGCFDQAIEGIKILKKHGIETQPVTVIHKGNIDQLEEMYRYFRDMDIYSWRIVNVDPIGRANLNDGIFLDGKDLKRMYDFIREKRFDPDNPMEVTTACSHFVSYEYEREIRDNYFQCGAGTMIASITANGDIFACLDIERRKDLIQGNIYVDDFIDVWENRFSIFRQNKALKSKTCNGCVHKDTCMGDSTHTWNFDTNEPNYCVFMMLEELKNAQP